MDNQDLRLAVLIDADNAPRTALRDIMAEAAVYGTPTVKRIYGDWTTPNMASWKPLLLEHAITPIQQYSYTTGKNATDSAMIIDAMDLLYSGRCDGFVLVSSDSDFTRLATRLREAGMKVYGMGEKKTPLPFIVACDKFIYIEVIRAAGEKARQEALAASAPDPEPSPEPEKESQAPAAKKPAKKAAKKKSAPAQQEPPEPEEIAGVPRAVVDLIADSLESIADEDGYGFMGKLGNLLLKKQPDFDPRNYGYSKLTQLVKALGRFEVVSRQTSADDPTKHVYLRDKQRK
ncbi:NYN domain-containing protein [Pseudoflavonifractor intestinihominis]|uniref:NYN domain-containing protein n=1 Tax=Pseudoflavonifractor intestinihominis TaxID=3133171 RepID=A0ABV1E7Q2_9FIRM|nr:NYN domain-containing protein [uncultured Pseudoflavonifractor sp.]